MRYNRPSNIPSGIFPFVEFISLLMKLFKVDAKEAPDIIGKIASINRGLNI